MNTYTSHKWMIKDIALIVDVIGSFFAKSERHDSQVQHQHDFAKFQYRWQEKFNHDFRRLSITSTIIAMSFFIHLCDLYVFIDKSCHIFQFFLHMLQKIDFFYFTDPILSSSSVIVCLYLLERSLCAQVLVSNLWTAAAI